MSYTAANLALNNSATLGSRSAGAREWVLRGTDAINTVVGASFISDAVDKGMSVNDLVTYIRTDTFEVYDLVVASMSSTAATLDGRGAFLGVTSTTPLSLWGVAATTQPSEAAQAAVATTAAQSTASTWGFSTSTQANGVIALLNAIQRALVASGAMKGS